MSFVISFITTIKLWLRRTLVRSEQLSAIGGSPDHVEKLMQLKARDIVNSLNQVHYVDWKINKKEELATRLTYQLVS
jgi:hypothetical protein